MTIRQDGRVGELVQAFIDFDVDDNSNDKYDTIFHAFDHSIPPEMPFFFFLNKSTALPLTFIGPLHETIKIRTWPRTIITINHPNQFDISGQSFLVPPLLRLNLELNTHVRSCTNPYQNSTKLVFIIWNYTDKNYDISAFSSLIVDSFLGLLCSIVKRRTQKLKQKRELE